MPRTSGLRICLHGGPGSTHNYFEVLDNVADDDDRMIIMYDQLGCGKSYLDGHPEMWTQDLWLDELDALREHLGLKECHIIGQSWGGMMQIAYAIERGAEGVKSFIISSGHPSSSLWARAEPELRPRARHDQLPDQKRRDGQGGAGRNGRTSGGPELPDLLAQRAVYGQNVHLDSVDPVVPQARHRDALPRKEPVKCSIKR